MEIAIRRSIVVELTVKIRDKLSMMFSELCNKLCQWERSESTGSRTGAPEKKLLRLKSLVPRIESDKPKIFEPEPD